jgi:hypothetical protein
MIKPRYDALLILTARRLILYAGRWACSTWRPSPMCSAAPSSCWPHHRVSRLGFGIAFVAIVAITK